jgi:hypothetical protein
MLYRTLAVAEAKLVWSGHPARCSSLGVGVRLGRPALFLIAAKPFLFPYLEVMEVRLNNPEIQAKIDRWVTETGRGPDELIEDAVAGYFEELTQTRGTLNTRYDDLKSGRVKPVSGDQVVAHFREKSAARRSRPIPPRVPSRNK